MSKLLSEVMFEYRSGDRVTFLIPEGVVLNAGQRYKVALHEIEESDERRTVDRLEIEPSKVAEKLIGRPDFQSWSKARMRGMGRGNVPQGAVTALNFIKIVCAIASIEELDINESANLSFERLVEVPFYRHLAFG